MTLRPQSRRQVAVVLLSGVRRQTVGRRTALVAGLALALTGSAALDGQSKVASWHDLPGALPRSEAQRLELDRRMAELGSGHIPRTEHLTPDSRPQFVNRLLLEESPYLLQHAHNPVDWQPWGEAAFALARRLDRPVFLSIGYSTCHWCHVKERESFDDIEIARQLNEHYVCIKVDREQRPDVDALYMTAVQLATGSGGWPLSALLTPEGKPFFGGAYFPRENFAELLERGAAAWRDRREDVTQSAERLQLLVAEASAASSAAGEVGSEGVSQAVRALLAAFDSELGGFGRAPKFPHEPELLLLEQVSLRGGREVPAGESGLDLGAVVTAVDRSLDAMARGGIHDQVGGGFHRYSTDARWLVPHFEKMLYNQSQLGRVYLGGYRATGDLLHARVARQILDYVLREMTDDQGRFFSATDADSATPSGEIAEGAYFLWRRAELETVLSPADAQLAVELFGAKTPNFEGQSILFLPVSLQEVAARRGVALEELLLQVDRIRAALREIRQRRPPPFRDQKVLAGWNGMMIVALAEAAETFNEPRYRDAALRAAAALWSWSPRKDGGLWRVLLDGRPSIPALQDDYANVAQALVAIYDLTADRQWLERAIEIADLMHERFFDSEGGGYFLSERGADPALLVRTKDPGDGAVPSGNSVAVRTLARLWARTGEPRFKNRCEQTVSAFSSAIARHPSSFSYLLLGLDELRSGEVGPLEYAGGGAVRITATVGPAGTDGHRRLEVALAIRSGWHINANAVLDEELVPTEVRLADSQPGWRMGDVRFPDPEVAEVAALGGRAAVWTGSQVIVGDLEPVGEDSPRSLRLRVRLQACDENRCLAPEDLVLELYAR